jgi:ABC-type lipoprotein export system ATPase subunit
MKPLLAFANVSMRHPDGGRELLVLDRVFLDIAPGDSVGVYGPRRSGKSTLLRLAAGIATPDVGSVIFDGRDTNTMSAAERARLLRGDIAFVSSADWQASPGETVVDHVATSLGSAGLSLRQARRSAAAALEEVGLGAAVTAEAACAVSLADRTRVMLARALVRSPRLLILDEPALMPDVGERDRFYALLRSVARDRRIALLVASEEMAALQGMATLVSIAAGELCSTAEEGVVVRLPTRRHSAVEGA